MECLRCGAEASPGKALCEICLAAPRSIPPLLGQELPAQKIPLWAILLVLPIVLIIFLFIRGSKPVPFKGVQLQTISGEKSELCNNKKGCIVVFVAPWCSACRGHVGFVNELAAVTRNTNLGLEVVVGWAEPAQLREFGHAFNAKVFIDADNKFRSRLSFSSVPRWFAVNAQQEVVDSFHPSYFQGESPLEQLKYIVEHQAKELSGLLP